MANILDRNTDFLTNGTVTSAGLHNLIDDTNIYAGLISTQAEKTTVGTADLLLVADSSSIGSPQVAANRTTVYNLFEDALTGGTYVNASLSGALTYGTATGNRTVSTSATITTGTIPNLTSSTANITLGTIPTLTAGTTTSTAANITNGTIQTLTASTGTITNLSTTLAGDFTISQGTGTLGTTGATLGTYGGSASVPVLAINAKGQVTSTGTAAISSGLTGFRNRIINGDMRIDQRNAGASVTPTVDGSYNLDRWAVRLSQGSKFSVQRNAGAITPPSGFTNYLGVTSLSSYSVTASDYFALVQYIEGFDISDLAFGSAGAKTVSISFWVRSSLTGTFGGSLENVNVNRSYPFSYAISASNTWEQKTITIAGDTTGTWSSDNSIGFRLHIGLGVGSDPNRSNTAGAWVGAESFSATGAVSVVGTNGATFYITGVQLEAGSTATDFERRPIGAELALCQRYYYRISGINNYQPVGSGTNRSTTTCRISSVVPSPMRTTPTVTISTGANNLLAVSSSTDLGTVTLSNAFGGSNSMILDLSLNNHVTSGDAIVVYVGTDNNWFAQFNSEL